MTQEYHDTVALLVNHGKPINGAALGKIAGVDEKAMRYRLKRLEMTGHVTRSRNGREWLWAVAG